nr:MAG TPA: hypothetical protein [Caudoviricetes sp.]
MKEQHVEKYLFLRALKMQKTVCELSEKRFKKRMA